MATVDWNGAIGAWDDHFNWNTNAVPTLSDDVVIDGGGAYIYSGYAAFANSVTIGSDVAPLSIGGGGSLTVTAGLTLGVDSSIGLSLGGGTSLSVGGNFVDNGELHVVVGTVTVTTKIAVSATGEIIADGGTVSTATIVNSGVRQSGNVVGNNDGVYVDEGATATSGTLDVTGLFTNRGTLGVGDFGGANTVTIGTLTNEATGGVGLGTVNMTVTTLNNFGTPTNTAPAGFGIDSEKYQNGGNLTVTEILTNTGFFGVGHANSTTTVKVGTIVNKLSGVVDIAGGSVTAENIDNSAGPNGSAAGGFGVNYIDDEAGGSLNVTGTFTNSGISGSARLAA